MICPKCRSRLVPHVDIKEETTWICPSCGLAICGLQNVELEKPAGLGKETSSE